MSQHRFHYANAVHARTQDTGWSRTRRSPCRSRRHSTTRHDTTPVPTPQMRPRRLMPISHPYAVPALHPRRQRIQRYYVGIAASRSPGPHGTASSWERRTPPTHKHANTVSADSYFSPDDAQTRQTSPYLRRARFDTRTPAVCQTRKQMQNPIF